MKRKNLLLMGLLSLFCLLSYADQAWAPPASKVRITNVNDLNLGNWAQTSMTGDDPVCIHRSDGVGTYRIVATDNSTISPATFALENVPKTAQIAYALTWGNTSLPGATALPDGVLTVASGANTTSQTCNGGTTANFKVDINNSALAAVPAGTYTATVTFVIQP